VLAACSTRALELLNFCLVIMLVGVAPSRSPANYSCHLLERQQPSPEITARLKDELGLWLIATSRRDAVGKIWDAHAPIHSAGELDALIRWLAISPATPAVLDALFGDQEAEYLDAMAFDKALRQIDRPARQ
jgi:hypothetical protein